MDARRKSRTKFEEEDSLTDFRKTLLSPNVDRHIRNWNFQLSIVLLNYLEYINSVEYNQVNFAETGVLIMRCSHVYSVRVDMMHELAMDCVLSFNAINKNKDSNEERKAKRKYIQSALYEDDLNLLDLFSSKGSLNLKCGRKNNISKNIGENDHITKIWNTKKIVSEVFDRDNIVIGNKHNFRLYWGVRCDGLLLEDPSSDSLEIPIELSNLDGSLGPYQDIVRSPVTSVNGDCNISDNETSDESIGQENATSSIIDMTAMNEETSRLWGGNNSKQATYNSLIIHKRLDVSRSCLNLPEDAELPDAEHFTFPNAYEHYRNRLRPRKEIIFPLNVCLLKSPKNKHKVDSLTDWIKKRKKRRKSQLKEISLKNNNDETVPDLNMDDSNEDDIDEQWGHLTGSHNHFNKAGPKNRRKAVRDWHKRMRPILAKVESRGYFNIERYKRNILNKFEGVGETISFANIARGKEQADVSRIFLATLTLANCNNLEIIKTDPSDLSTNCLDIKVLNFTIHSEELDRNVAAIAGTSRNS